MKKQISLGILYLYLVSLVIQTVLMLVTDQLPSRTIRNRTSKKTKETRTLNHDRF